MDTIESFMKLRDFKGMNQMESDDSKYVECLNYIPMLHFGFVHFGFEFLACFFIGVYVTQQYIDY